MGNHDTMMDKITSYNSARVGIHNVLPFPTPCICLPVPRFLVGLLKWLHIRVYEQRY